MKNPTGLAFIFFFLLLGMGVSTISPLPIPGGIFGMVLMLLYLLLRPQDLKVVEPSANALIENMQIMFIPGGVGLMAMGSYVEGVLFPLLLLLVLSTVVTIGVTALVTDYCIEKFQKR